MAGVLLQLAPTSGLAVWPDLIRSFRQDAAKLRRENAELRQEVTRLREENAELRRENAELKQQAGYWKAQHARAVDRERQLQADLEQLRGENRELRSQIFGQRSEKSSTKDRSNQLDGENGSDTPPSSPSRKRGQQPGQPGPKRRDHSQLPVREEPTRELPPDQQVCPQCQAPLVANGTEDSEQIEIEVEAYRRKIQRQRYQRTCTCADCPRTIIAPPAPKLIPKGLLGTSVWVEILLAKFLAQQPLERLLMQWRLLELDLAPGTVAGGPHKLVPLFEPLYETIRERNKLSAFLQADETRWLVFIDHEGKTGHNWWLWLFLGEDTVCYILDPSRSHNVPEGHFNGVDEAKLLVDRYSGYKAMKQVKDGHVVLAFCWAHVRRDFIKVGKGWTELKEWAPIWLRRIRVVYQLQRQRLALPAGSSQRTFVESQLRQQLADMKAQAEKELAEAHPRLPCQKALESLLNHWSGLTLFLDDPRIPLDNNAAERLQRGPAVGRKNYYGSGAHWSGTLAAMLFSIFATLTKWDINPRKWLTWYLQSCAENGGQIPQNSTAFLPWNLSPEQTRMLRTERSESPDSS